jgi:hypothetical protein
VDRRCQGLSGLEAAHEVSLVDLRTGELAVHETSRVQVAKAVPDPRPDPFHTHVLGRKQHHVVKLVQSGRGAERVKEPR